MLFPRLSLSFLLVTTLSAYQSSTKIVQLGIDSYEKGFWLIDPYKTYKQPFAHYADLNVINDLRVVGGYSQDNKNSFDSLVLQGPACRGMDKTTVYTENGLEIDNAYYSPGRDYALINVLQNNKFLFNMHEMGGHGFARLSDEYLAGSAGLLSELNCEDTLNPWWIRAGFGSLHTGCSEPMRVRSTLSSIMGGNEMNDGNLEKPMWGRPQKFNLVGCERILEVINNRNPYDAFKILQDKKLDCISEPLQGWESTAQCEGNSWFCDNTMKWSIECSDPENGVSTCTADHKCLITDTTKVFKIVNKGFNLKEKGTCDSAGKFHGDWVLL